MKKITKIEKTSPGCPEQYQGTLDTGELFYIRCRFGHAELRVGNQEQWDSWELPVVSVKNYPDNMQGEFDPGDLEKLLIAGGVEPCAIPEDLDQDRIAKLKENFERLLQQKDKGEEPSIRQSAIMLTMDEDILRGKALGKGEQEMMQEAKRQFKVRTLNISKDEL